MIHSDDRQALQRMLRGDLTPEVTQEAELRTQLFHRDGNSGRLGTIECINILRFLGLGVLDEVRNAPLETYDFRKIAIGSDLWVKNEQDGYYRKATYVGDHPMGRVAIRFVGSGDVHGVKPCLCLRYEPPADQIYGSHTNVIVDSPIVEDIKNPKKATGKKPEPAGV